MAKQNQQDQLKGPEENQEESPAQKEVSEALKNLGKEAVLHDAMEENKEKDVKVYKGFPGDDIRTSINHMIELAKRTNTTWETNANDIKLTVNADSDPDEVFKFYMTEFDKPIKQRKKAEKKGGK